MKEESAEASALKLGALKSERLACGVWEGKERQFVKGRLVVSVRARHENRSSRELCGADDKYVESTLHRLIKRLPKSKIYKRIPGDTAAVIAMPDEVDVVESATMLVEQNDVAFAEPIFPLIGLGVPNDRRYRQQWGFEEIGMPEAWDFETGSPQMVILIADSGVPLGAPLRPAHSDFDWTRFIHLFDAVDGTFEDGHGHGTLIAGTIAAAADNVIGVAGINWTSPVVIARVLDNNNQNVDLGTYALYESMTHALMALPQNLRLVVNLSLISEPSRLIAGMCKQARWAGVIFCCGAGNIFSAQVEFPASLSTQLDNVISVGAVDDAMNLTAHTPPGPGITVVAPGKNIYSTLPDYQVNGWSDTGYGFGGGTSMATAFVTGLVSLVWSRKLTIKHTRVIAAITRTARPLVGSVAVPHVDWGYGLIDAHAAVAGGLDIT